MVRVAGLQDQVRAGFHKAENKSGLTPKEQLAKIAERTQALVRRQTEVYRHLIYDLLPQHNVHIADMKDLNSTQKAFINEMFAETIFPVLTPVAVDAYRPFPTLLGKTLNLLVLLEQDESDLESREKSQSFRCHLF